jgi:hypothetical protein
MQPGDHSPQSAVLILLRIDRDHLRNSIESKSIRVIQPSRRFSGRGRPWFVLEENGFKFHLNGLIAVVESTTAETLQVSFREDWPNLCEQLLIATDMTPRVLLDMGSMTAEIWEALDYYTGAIEMLDNLMSFALSRPGATGREITACEQWLHGSFTQYLTGRGALRNVVLPWRTWLERYEYLLRSLEGELEQLSSFSADRLIELFRGLEILNTGRDRNSIIHEYRTRLGDLTDACNRVSAEIGVIGTFGSLALVPFESTLGILFLIPVIVTGTAYYGGYNLARTVLRRTRWRRARIAPSHTKAVGGHEPRNDLSSTLRALTEGPVEIVVSPRLSAADIACALEMRLQLLERTTCPNPLTAITLGTSGSNGVMRIVIGGPLVRANLQPFIAPECDLTDSLGDGWVIAASGTRIVHCDDDETVGCCVVGTDGRTLFVFGVRDSGTVVATRWLGHALDDTTAAGTANWILLRRDKNHQPEEISRG